MRSPFLCRTAASLALALALGVAPGSAGAQPGQPGPKGSSGAASKAQAGGPGKGAPGKEAASASDAVKVDPKQREEAKRHWEAGTAFYNDPSGHKCEEAYREFKKAYDLSGSLNALKAMGICALELERDGEAIERFEKYLAGKGAQIESADKEQVENDLKALKAAVAQVTLRADRPGVRVTDVRTPSKGPQVTNDYALSGEQTIGIHPGRHTFTASVEGEPPLIWTVEIGNGGTYAHTFDFEAVKTAAALASKPKDTAPVLTERPVPVAVFVLGGLTAALAVPTGLLMVRANGKKRDFEAQNGKLPGAQLEDVRADVQEANLVADIFLGATVASLAVTGIVYLTRPSRPVDKVGWILAPAVGTSGGGALLTGRF